MGPPVLRLFLVYFSVQLAEASRPPLKGNAVLTLYLKPYSLLSDICRALRVAIGEPMATRSSVPAPSDAIFAEKEPQHRLDKNTVYKHGRRKAENKKKVTPRQRVGPKQRPTVIDHP